MFFISGALIAQDFQGNAYYQSKTSMDMSSFGNNQMSEQQKRMMAERMKSRLEKTFILSFNRTESVYKEEEKLAAPVGGRGRMVMMGISTLGVQYKNVKEQHLVQSQEFFGKQFLIKDSLLKLEWKMESESKQIGEYLCFKATAMIKGEENYFSNMRRRNNNDEIKEGEKSRDTAKSTNLSDEIEGPNGVLVTAWYTPQIPVNQGPGDYWGLPGLILEVNSGDTTILCSKIEINPTDKTEIKAPSKGKVVTKKDYDAIVTDKTKEMQEMYRGRGGDRR